MNEQTLADRVTALERQNRRLRGGVVALALAAGATVSMAQVPLSPPEVRAQRVVLVDQQGDVRIELRADLGTPSVMLRDGTGLLVELTGAGRRAAVRYRDEDGAIRDLAAPLGPRPATRR